ncbi:SRPBCC family protein [Tomitella biformata]|uniref:SRPBCC family protein n=1 Tax=Tomitella biformata TaxID=630403 RepID=UPI000463EE04|nr:SRPBCC domain-containing protein [Tomitella biformata]
MTVISSKKDLAALRMTIVAEFDATIERVWQIWADPRKLERWWGPPTWPATFARHDFTVGGESRYFMTGPEGEKAPGWWRMTAIDGPHSLEFDDGFAGEDGEPDPAMPTIHAAVALEASGAKTRMSIVSTFATTEQFEQVIEMGMEEGMTEAMGQIDAILTEG